MANSGKSESPVMGDGPYRSPPQPDFVCFSESARIILECLQLNCSEGVFIGTLKSRVPSLAVIEALDTRAAKPCHVKLVGRLEEKLPPPTPLVRITWTRAITSLPPHAFFEVMQQRYGLALDLNPGRFDARNFPHGTEFDFIRRQVLPREPDSARGDESGSGLRSLPTDLRRYVLDDQNPRETLGTDHTIMKAKDDAERP